MNQKTEQGEIITVWNGEGTKVEREFVAMAPDNKYICYTKNKHDVSLWEHAEPINTKPKTIAKYRYILNGKWAETKYFHKTAWDAQVQEDIDVECIEIPNTRIEV